MRLDPSTFWSQLTLTARLLAISSIALLGAGAAILLLATRQAAEEAHIDLSNELAEELVTLPDTLAETVVIGDFASLQQQLDRYATRPDVINVSFTDNSGKFLQSNDKPQAAQAPDWFLKALAYEDVAGTATINVGGRAYGTIGITLSAQGPANRTWQRLGGQVLVLLLALVLDFFAIWWILRSGLAPLKRLQSGAEAIAGGALETRLAIEGSPELRALITSFNGMATVIQDVHERLRLSNVDLQRFAEISAHHLQEPARRMASYAERLSKQLAGKLQDSDAQLSLDFIGQQARYQQNLLRDVERYLAADQPRGELALIDPRQTVNAILARRQERISAAEAEITIGKLPPAWIDAPRLADLFEILLENALQHGVAKSRQWPDGTPITGELHITLDGESIGDMVRYRISDNGPGIETEYHERVFRAFERLQSGGAGTGIGLAIVRRITVSCSGRAYVDAAHGGGCCVVLELSAKESA
jgi:signal transduction histidine kinase